MCRRIAECTLLCFSLALSTNVWSRDYDPLKVRSDLRPASDSVYVPVKESARPYVPGFRDETLELFEDSLRRKRPVSVGNSRSAAHAAIVRTAWRDPMKRSHMKGAMAEAMYLGKNPQWGYVASAQASQHDVYSWIDGRRSPWTAQIKTHISSNPNVYASDMLTDHRSPLFLVPDDHVAPLRAHWQEKIASFRSSGQIEEANMAERQYGRIRGLGFDTKDLDSSMMRAVRNASSEHYAGYVSVASTLALAIASMTWSSDGIPSTVGQQYDLLGRATSLFAAERLATTYVRHAGGNELLPTRTALAHRGSTLVLGGLRGNSLVGATIVATDSLYSIATQGGSAVFKRRDFYSNLGGSFSSVGAGLIAGEYVTSTTANPIFGVTAAMAAGMIAYIGGSTLTDLVLEKIDPEVLRVHERLATKHANWWIETLAAQEAN